VAEILGGVNSSRLVPWKEKELAKYKFAKKKIQIREKEQCGPAKRKFAGNVLSAEWPPG
jgi:hypothetical protein